MQWNPVFRFVLLLLAVFPLMSRAQDTVFLDGSKKNLNHSIANEFTIYSSSELNTFDMLQSNATWRSMEHTKINQSVENLDFTTDYHYIHFVLVNRTKKNLKLYLETARPITNTVRMLPIRGDSVKYDNEVISGDGIAFEDKTIPTNHSALPIYLPANDTITYLPSVVTVRRSLYQ